MPTRLRCMKLTVAIVDDDPRYRSSLAHAVMSAPDMALVGAADDLHSGRTLLDSSQPQILLVDLGLPTGSGLDLIRHAAEHLPACDVMVITVFGDERHVIASIEAGATGYLLKDASNGELADHIRALHAGGSPISPVIARQLLTRFAAPSAAAQAKDEIEEDVPQALSPQEHKVLLMISKGNTHDEIAKMMGVSRQTVLTYVKRTYRKLQVHGKVEAIVKAQRTGLIAR